MRIVIASSCVPFAESAADKIVDDLQYELSARDFNVDVVRIPFRSEWSTIARQTLALRLFDLSECGDRIDRLIAVGTPCHALRHPNKTAWFVHHDFEARDSCGAPKGISESDTSRRCRDAMHHAGDLYLRECKKVFTDSRSAAEHLQQSYSFESASVLYAPLTRDDAFHPGEFGDYFLYPSRVASLERQQLAIQAMQHAHPEIRLVIVGTFKAQDWRSGPAELVQREGLAGRVRVLGVISEERHAELLSGCRAVLSLPALQDSCGYAMLEAFHSGKPVITLTDSGGSLEVVEDGVNGLVVPPEPLALAAAMNRLWAEPDEARRLGAGALSTPQRHRIDWDHVVESLTA